MWTVIKSILFRLIDLGLFLWKNRQQQIEGLAADVKSLGQAEAIEQKLTDLEKQSMEDLRSKEKQLIEDSNHVDCTDLVDIINRR